MTASGREGDVSWPGTNAKPQERPKLRRGHTLVQGMDGSHVQGLSRRQILFRIVCEDALGSRYTEQIGRVREDGWVRLPNSRVCRKHYNVEDVP